MINEETRRKLRELNLEEMVAALDLQSADTRYSCKNRHDLAICTEKSCHLIGPNLPPYRTACHWNRPFTGTGFYDILIK